MADLCLCNDEKWSVVVAALVLPVEPKVLTEGGLLGWEGVASEWWNDSCVCVQMQGRFSLYFTIPNFRI